MLEILLINKYFTQNIFPPLSLSLWWIDRKNFVEKNGKNIMMKWNCRKFYHNQTTTQQIQNCQFLMFDDPSLRMSQREWKRGKWKRTVFHTQENQIQGNPKLFTFITTKENEEKIRFSIFIHSFIVEFFFGHRIQSLSFNDHHVVHVDRWNFYVFFSGCQNLKSTVTSTDYFHFTIIVCFWMVDFEKN